MALTAFGQLAKKTLARTGVRAQVNTAVALDRTGKVLAVLLDEDMIQGVRPAFIRFRTLTLACMSSSYAACVAPFEVEILEYVNKGFEKPIADRLRVVLDNDYLRACK
ncbi:MAG: hypothetical protein Q7R79_02985 [bacterium]|nr:hypothetical protein [bacterium]